MLQDPSLALYRSILIVILHKVKKGSLYDGGALLVFLVLQEWAPVLNSDKQAPIQDEGELGKVCFMKVYQTN